MSEKPISGAQKTGENDVPSASGKQEPASAALTTTVIAGAHDLQAGAKHLADDVVDQTTKAAKSQVSLGKTKAAEGLGSVANALRKTGESLRVENDGALTDYIDQAAQKVDAASSYLRHRSVPALVGDVKQFARREPALFLGGALVMGLLAGRFLKSSHPEAISSANANGGGGTAHTHTADGHQRGNGSANGDQTRRQASGIASKPATGAEGSPQHASPASTAGGTKDKPESEGHRSTKSTGAA